MAAKKKAKKSGSSKSKLKESGSSRSRRFQSSLRSGSISSRRNANTSSQVILMAGLSSCSSVAGIGSAQPRH